jgi:hypothetical protein
MEIEIGKKASAWIPVVMSLGALALVVIQIAMHGVQPQHDEGALAHLWQLLVLAQLPIIGLFVFRWMRPYPSRSVPVLATQLVALATALVPVHTMGW